MTEPIRFSLNGTLSESTCRADMTVLEWLRQEALLRGSKEGCAEGDCGACSVLLRRPDSGGNNGWLPANSCILTMGQLSGAEIITVEGLAAMGADGHPVQEAMAENGSSQCGFCTPGIVVALAGLLERSSSPDEHEIHDALAGNLCRCTGYRPIVEAAQKAAASGTSLPKAIGDDMSALSAGSSASQVHLPVSLEALLLLLKERPDATLLAGGTDIGIDVAHAKARWSEVISTRRVRELREIKDEDGKITIGGAVTWEELLPHAERFWPSFATLIRRFGSTQIRSMGTIAGNLATASPIGDGAPALIALGATIVIAGGGGERKLPLEDFFINYRQSALVAGEVIKAVELPTSPVQFRAYKVSKRYDQDISTVCGAFALTMEGEKVARARVAFGGMAATPVRCPAAEDALTGGILEASSEKLKDALLKSFTPMTDMRGSAEYRAAVAANLGERLIRDLAGDVVEVMAL